MNFSLVSDFKPKGDQILAIDSIVSNLNSEVNDQVLLGVTGSGKTFTVANVISKINKPTLIIAHNKTLAAQLYSEFKSFFPKDRVEYFVSYYDYYQPEAYIAVTNKYIKKDMSINKEIEKYRIKTISSLLSKKNNVIVVASVSALYGLSDPNMLSKSVIDISLNMQMDREVLLKKLVRSMYSRVNEHLRRGSFKVQGDTVLVSTYYDDLIYRISFWGDKIDMIDGLNIDDKTKQISYNKLSIYPQGLFISSQERLKNIIKEIRKDLIEQIAFLKNNSHNIEANRLEERVNLDIEMLKELGYCSGIENYSKYFDGRESGQRPFCLFDYFPYDYMLIIDESHVTVPQISGSYHGDRARKSNLVQYGFRLPSAMDNRPINFDEFLSLKGRTIYVSATPADYEINKSEGLVIEQLTRPTGLLDPEIEIKPCKYQVDDLIEQIQPVIEKKERVLVIVLTKKMAEELADYLKKIKIKSEYIHSDVDTLDRIAILNNLRKGLFDVIIGVNILREGIDLPEVSLVCILDGDKEGFLRSYRSLTQMCGRAARNINGKVIIYADKITNSIKKTIGETNRRREKQMLYNKKNNIKPQQIKRKVDESFTTVSQKEIMLKKSLQLEVEKIMANNPSKDELIAMTKELEKAIKLCIKNFEFIQAAKYRDKIKKIRLIIEKK